MLIQTVLTWFLATSLAFGASVGAGPRANYKSGLGVNVSTIAPGSTELPFLNILKMSGGFFVNGGTGSPTALDMQTDANGYPTSMALLNSKGTATSFQSNMMVGLGVSNNGTVFPLRSGNYVLLYIGAGTAALGADQTLIAGGGTTRQVWNSPVGAGQMSLLITAAPVTNVAIVYSPDSTGVVVGMNERKYLNGELFNPDFLAEISQYRALRFMQAQNTYTSITQNWSDRTAPNFYFYAHQPGDSRWADAQNVGMPVEIIVALCNQINADCWFNMPAQATDAYITSFATFVHIGGADRDGKAWPGLNPNLKAYVEYMNENWTPNAWSTANQTAITALGTATFPSCVGDSFCAMFYYSIYRAITERQLWRAAWGTDAGRVIGVLGGQMGFESRNTTIMNFQPAQQGGNPSLWSGTAASNVDAFTTAPYFPFGNEPVAWTADSDGGYARSFADLMTGGQLPVQSGLPTTSGGPTVFTVTSGLGLPSTPANGTCIGLTLNQSASSGATLAADGGTAFQLTDFYGNAQAFGASSWCFCFTNQIALLLNFATTSGGNGQFLQGVVIRGQTSGASGTVVASNQTQPVGGGGQVSLVSTSGTFLNGETIVGGAVSAVLSAGPSGGSVTGTWRLVNFGYATGTIQQVIDQTVSNFNNANTHGLPLVFYESGQGFANGVVTGLPNYDAFTNYTIQLNRDPRMGVAYTKFLKGTSTSGVQVNVHYAATGKPSNFGSWGASENLVQPESPKLQAIRNFIQTTPCWWGGC